VKRTATVILGLAAVATGLWVVSAVHVLNSACSINAETFGGGTCVSGVPYYIIGFSITAIGVVSIVLTLFAMLRRGRPESALVKQSPISTLRHHESEILRDAA
jgi:hypothetical protein